jgi:hypothetical protein
MSTGELLKESILDQRLQVEADVVQSYMSPLQLRNLFVTDILPLFSMQSRLLSRYWVVLQSASLEVCSGQPTLIMLLLKEVFRVWPKVDTYKEELFLGLLESVFDLLTTDCDVIDLELLGGLEQTLFQCLSRAVTSSHYEVSEKAIKLIDNFPPIVNITFSTPDHVLNILPTVYRALISTLRNHPFNAVRFIAAALANYLEKATPETLVICDRLWSEIDNHEKGLSGTNPPTFLASLSDDSLAPLDDLALMSNTSTCSVESIPSTNTMFDVNVSSPARRLMRMASWNALEAKAQVIADTQSREHAHQKVSGSFKERDNRKLHRSPPPRRIFTSARGPWESAPDSPSVRSDSPRVRRDSAH